MNFISKERNIVKERCGQIGIAFSAGFWIIVACSVILCLAGITIGSYPESDFQLSFTELPTGKVGVAYFLGGEKQTFLDEFRYLEFDTNELTVAAEDSPKKTFLIGFFGGIPAIAAFAGIMWLLRKIFRNVQRYETPFLEENSRAVFWIGVLVIAIGFFRGTVYPAVLFFAGAGPGDFTVYNLGALGAGIPFFCLAYIFEYGCALQKESDETL